METTLHRQLKEKFREPDSQIEVKLGRYRIDVVNGDRLMEIQRSGLSAIRDKINNLLKDGYIVDVVKPLIARKRLIKLSRKNGKEIGRRWSPRRGSILDLFDELVYLTRVFPHSNLTLITPLIQTEEVRYPGHGKRRRKRNGDFVVADRLILDMDDAYSFKTVQDLQSLLPKELPKTFDTKELAACMGIKRHDAQRIAYVLRKTGAAIETGKKGNAILCRLATKTESKKALKAKRPTRTPAAARASIAKAVGQLNDAKIAAKEKAAKKVIEKAVRTVKKKTTAAKIASTRLKKSSTSRTRKSKAA